MAHLNVDATTVQWLTSAYALVEAIVIPLAAWFMGRFSTRFLFIGAMSLFACGSLSSSNCSYVCVYLARSYSAGNGNRCHDGNGYLAYLAFVSS